MFNKNKRRIKRVKKLTGHEFAVKEPLIDSEFYVKLNRYDDLSVLVLSPEDGSYREFIVDVGALVTLFRFVEGRDIEPIENLVKTKDIPYYIKLMSKGSQIITSRENKMYGTVLLANVNKYGDEDGDKSITLRRVAYIPKRDNYLMGVDTISLNMYLAKEVFNKIKQLFKGVDIEIELEGEKFYE